MEGWTATACGCPVSKISGVCDSLQGVTCGSCLRVLAADDLNKLQRAWSSVKGAALRRFYFMRAGVLPGTARNYSKKRVESWPVALRADMRRQLMSNPDCARILCVPCLPIPLASQHDKRGAVGEAWRLAFDVRNACPKCGGVA